MPRKSNPALGVAPPPGARLFTEREVLALIRVSRATLDRWVREDDGTFPKPIKLHAGGSKRWLANEFDDWIMKRSNARV